MLNLVEWGHPELARCEDFFLICRCRALASSIGGKWVLTKWVIKPKTSRRCDTPKKRKRACARKVRERWINGERTDGSQNTHTLCCALTPETTERPQ
jgi:hypothetical protein